MTGEVVTMSISFEVKAELFIVVQSDGLVS
jgi:hypothetical protein